MSKEIQDKNDILDEFKSKKELLKKFASKVEALIVELLIDRGVAAHQISVRVKEEDSLSNKLDRKVGKYNSLKEVTDIVGVRIIVYLENEVDDVANIIDSEFTIDRDNTVDKRKLEVASFGYKSLHYVVSLNEERCKLTEYKRFKDLKAEIQIRSVLQHAWAEIEHDLGYKGAIEIPDQHKRTFHRVAALLETADLAFVELKADLKEYEKEVPKDIKERPEEVRIDKASLTSYLETSSLVAKMDAKIVESLKSQLKPDRFMTTIILEKIGFFPIYSIKDLNDLLKGNVKLVVEFAVFYLSGVDGQVPNGISVFYLLYVLLLQKSDLEAVRRYLNYGIKLGNDDFPEELIYEFENFKEGRKKGHRSEGFIQTIPAKES